MAPIKATLEVEIFNTFSYQDVGKISSIVNSAFSNRQTSGLEFLEEAKASIEKYILDDTESFLKEINKNFAREEFNSIDDVEVKLECKPIYGSNPVPEFSGSYKFYARSSEIAVLQFFSNQTIAYHSQSYPDVRFCQLDKTLTCYIVPNLWDLDS